MESRKLKIWLKIDKTLLGLYLVLVFFGLLTIYASSFKEQFPNIYDLNMPYGKQLFWIFACLIIGVAILQLDITFIQNASYSIYGVVLFLLILVLFTPAINGAHSWFQLGGFSIQPAEFAKLSCAMTISHYLNSPGVKIHQMSTKFTILLILAIPGFLILLEPDAGTLLVFFSFIFVMYREGLSGNILLGGFFAVLIAVIALFFKASEAGMTVLEVKIDATLIFAIILLSIGVCIHLMIKSFVLPRYRKNKYITNLVGITLAIGLVFITSYAYDNVFKDRHRDRFEVMFGIKEDVRGVGYNIHQALSAIGSGGGVGKGFLEGTLSNAKYNHVPEQSTDFIFCSLAEEWGFLGAFVMIVVYLAFLIRIIIITERQRSKYARIFGYCTASILFFHFMINIGMVIGLAPVIGIPLPFFSKGGSSILGFSILIFILLRLDAGRKDVLR